MSFALALKILTLAVLFVASGGALFSDWGRRHLVLVGMASIVAILGTFYLIADIYEDLKRDSVETLRQELLAQQQRQRAPPQPAQDAQPQPEPQPVRCDGVELGLASGGTKCIKPG